jgi:hypothetical protein
MTPAEQFKRLRQPQPNAQLNSLFQQWADDFKFTQNIQENDNDISE